MRPRMQVFLPLLFPGLLMISTLPMIADLDGEDGIAAGALFALVSMPVVALGYHFAKNLMEDMFVYRIFPILGFYPFAYAIRSPFSLTLAVLILLILGLSTREFKTQNSQISHVIFAFSLLTCLGLPSKTLLVVGLALLSLTSTS